LQFINYNANGKPKSLLSADFSLLKGHKFSVVRLTGCVVMKPFLLEVEALGMLYCSFLLYVHYYMHCVVYRTIHLGIQTTWAAHQWLFYSKNHAQVKQSSESTCSNLK
jgi:hypothetical protein